MRLARIEHDGNPVYAIVEGDELALIEGDPYGAHGTTGERVPLAGATLLCPATPTKIVAMAVNYRSHGEPVKVPQPFLKTPSALIGPEQPIVLPPDAGRVDEEGEVVAVMRRGSRSTRSTRTSSATPAGTMSRRASGRGPTCNGGAPSRPIRSPPSGPGSRRTSTRRRSASARG